METSDPWWGKNHVLTCGRVIRGARKGLLGLLQSNFDMANMNAQDRLHAAQRAVREGRYAEALSEFVWFHEHALEGLPSIYGVRLSFALSYWAHLAEVYPKARVVLEQIRDKKADAVLSPSADRALFHDVVAINRVLGCEQNTHTLFVANRRKSGFARGGER
jgi:hypothetical protein